MKIVIVGNGKVGFTLAEHLTHEAHDVTIIDTSPDTLRRSSERLDVMCLRGNGASITTLREAGVATADILIAVTSLDEVNMISCLSAKRLGCGYTIARIRNVEYTHDLSSMKKELDIDLVINPEFSTAVEIARLLRFPDAANIDMFCRGRVERVSFRAQAGDFILGKPLSSLRSQIQALPMLFCAVEREGDVFIPGGSFVMEEDDTVHLIGRPDGIHQFFKMLGRFTPKIKSVMIIGGGRIAYYLTTLLQRVGLRVKIIEQSEHRCRALSDMLPRALIIHGDGTDQVLLESEGLSDSGAFIALTNRDEDNLIISLYAIQRGTGKVIAKSNRQNYAGIARAAGLDSVLSPKLITAHQILHVVRAMENSKGSFMSALYKIADEQAEALEFIVGEGARYLGIALKDLRLKAGVLIAVILRQNQVIIPSGADVIATGDSVIIVTRNQGILDFNDIYTDAGSMVRDILGSVE